MAKATIVTTIRLPVEVRQKLDEYSRITGDNLTSIIIAALDCYID